MRLTSWEQPKPELKLEGRGPGRHREFIDLVICTSSTSSRQVSDAVLFLEDDPCERVQRMYPSAEGTTLYLSRMVSNWLLWGVCNASGRY